MLVLVKGVHRGLLYGSVHFCMVKVSVIKRTDRMNEYLLSSEPGTPSFQDSDIYLLSVIQMTFTGIIHHLAPFPRFLCSSSLSGSPDQHQGQIHSIGSQNLRQQLSESSHLQDRVEQGERVESKEPVSAIEQDHFFTKHSLASPRCRHCSESWEARSLS